MRKLTILFALLTLSVGLWAASIIYDVDYIDANGQQKKVTTAFEINNSDPLQGGWYVVLRSNLQIGSLVCEGAVHLILADGAKLTATGSDDWSNLTPGIQVSGEGNSLTIYAQSTDPNQMGQLIAIGGKRAAGIGGGNGEYGCNITINGGKVTAIGGDNAAGIGGGDGEYGCNITINGGEVTATGGKFGAGIGGGIHSSGYNITINGGTVMANGGENSAGIGSGDGGSGSSNIFVATNLIVKAGDYENPTDVIENNGGDLAYDLVDQRYVTIKLDLTPYITAAIGEIDSEIEGVTDETMLAVAAKAKTDIGNATTLADIIAIKTLAVEKLKDLYHILIVRQGIRNAEINSVINDAVNGIRNATTIEQITALHSEIATTIGLVQIGRREVKEELLGEMGEPCVNCTAVEVKKGDKVVTLYAPESVDYIKVTE